MAATYLISEGLREWTATTRTQGRGSGLHSPNGGPRMLNGRGRPLSSSLRTAVKAEPREWRAEDQAAAGGLGTCSKEAQSSLEATLLTELRIPKRCPMEGHYGLHFPSHLSHGSTSEPPLIREQNIKIKAIWVHKGSYWLEDCQRTAVKAYEQM